MQESLDKFILTIMGVVFIIIGSVEIVFLKRISKYAVDSWYRNFKIRINQALYGVVVLVSGLLFIFAGTRILFYFR